MRLWRRFGDDFDSSWLQLGPDLIGVLDLAQERVTAGSFTFIPNVLEQTGQRVRDEAYPLQADSLVGAAGDGRPTESLLYGGVARAKERVAAGATIAEALSAGGQFVTLAAGTVLSDTGRTAEKMAGHSRRVAMYTRMLNPPSCGRCVILAGTETSARTAFRRHPGCDCRNIPSSEAVADDLTVGADAYLDSLDDRELARALGSKANAQAWRDGADPIQLMNSYRSGVRTAQTYNGRITYTREGTTRRGLAYRAMEAAELTGGAARRTAADRYLSSRNVRLMPETIYARARNRDEALQMLRDYGWIQPERPGFNIVNGIATRVR
jgi:hypothetical protein